MENSTTITTLKYTPQNIDEGVLYHARRLNALPGISKHILDIFESKVLNRKETDCRRIDGENIIDYGVAQTPINVYSKYSDYIEHCIWLAIIARKKNSDPMVSGLVHVPSYIIVEDGTKWHDAFIYALNNYQQILNCFDSNYKVFYGGGAITYASKKHSQIYYKAEKKLQIYVNQYLSVEASKITNVKGKGSELIYVNTQKNHIITIQPDTKPII